MEGSNVQRNPAQRSGISADLNDTENALYESVRETYDPAQPYREMLHDATKQALLQVMERWGATPADGSQTGSNTMSHIWSLADGLNQEDREKEFRERCRKHRLNVLKVDHAGDMDGDGSPANDLRKDNQSPMRNRMDLSLYEEDPKTFKERRLLGMPRGVYYEQPNPLNIIFASEWNRETTLGPKYANLSAEDLIALRNWDDVCQAKASFSDQQNYLVCEAACYQKDQVCQHMSNYLRTDALPDLPGPVPAETPDLILRLRGLPLAQRPYIRLFQGDIPISWPTAIGHKISLKIECASGTRAAITLPVVSRLDLCFPAPNNMPFAIPSYYLSKSHPTVFSFLVDVDEGLSASEEKPRVFVIQTRAPTADEVADVDGRSPSGLDQAFEPYERMLSGISRDLGSR